MATKTASIPEVKVKVEVLREAQQEINSLRARLASTRRILRRLHEDYCTMVDRDFDPGGEVGIVPLASPSESPLYYPLRASVLKAINPPKATAAVKKSPISKSATASLSPKSASGGAS